MVKSISIPNAWHVKTQQGLQLTQPGDNIAFKQDSGVVCRIEGVIEEGDQLDFMCEVIGPNGEELETIWLSSTDYPTVSHTREEALGWVEDQLATYADY